MTPQPTVWHSLRYRDAPAAITFLTEVLGFEATLVVPDNEDRTVIHHAQLVWPEGGGVMLGSMPAAADTRPDWPQVPGNGGAYVVTDHPTAVHDRAVAAGAKILAPLTDQDGRGPAFSLVDAEGNYWSFGVYRGE